MLALKSFHLVCKEHSCKICIFHGNPRMSRLALSRWLIGRSMVLYSKRLQVRFWVRTHAWAAVWFPGQGTCKKSNQWVFLSHISVSLCPPFCLSKINKYILRQAWKKSIRKNVHNNGLPEASSHPSLHTPSSVLG